MRLQFDKKGSTGWITLTNPPYNSLVHPVFADKKELVEFLNDPALKSVILRGAGKHFCSGAEVESLSKLAQDPRLLKEALNQGKELLDIISRATIPVAALIFGSCLGGGLELALCCHFRFAASNAMFGFPESDLGLMPGMGGTILARELISDNHLIDLLLSGRMIRAEEAMEMGLVDTVSSSKTIEEKLVDFLDMLTCRHSPKLIRSVMRSIDNGRRLSTQEALAEETKLFCDLARESGLVDSSNKK